MARFRWHADYFERRDGLGRAVRNEIIQADNADEAAKIARSEMGSCARVDVRRLATAAPVRVIYACDERVARPSRPADPLPLANILSLLPIGARLTEML